MENGKIGSISKKDREKLDRIFFEHENDGECERRYGTIVVMDVLGWKKTATVDTIKKYCDLTNELRSKIFTALMRVSDNIVDEMLDIVVLSDTICIFLDIDCSYCELNIFSEISRFVVSALSKSIAFRGAISRGEYFINKRRNVFIGEAFYEAIKYAEATEWAGIILTDSIAKALLENNTVADLKQINITSYNDIPYKRDIAHCYENLVLIPKPLFSLSSNNVFEDISKMYIKTLKSDNEDVKTKLYNTLKFLKHLSLD